MGRLARKVFELAGWRTEGAPPPDDKYVVIAAPHTSNWDAVILLVCARIWDMPLAWFVKDSWVKGPLGPLLTRLGAVGIDRSARHGVVEQAIAAMQASDKMALAVPPEGTRKRVPHWKTGFYHIARGAKVPIVLGFIDYGRKVAGLGPAFVPTGDLEKDFEEFARFYAPIVGRYPDKFGPVAPPPSVPPAGPGAG